MLVNVKAYPALTKRHGETVCVAGLVDDGAGELTWGRIWPVPFRDLEWSRKFKLWQWIELDASPSTKDTRAESYTPNNDSIVTGELVDPSDGWRERREMIEPLMRESMCEIQADETVSLGVFRPGRTKVMEPEPNDPWSELKDNVAAQGSLLAADKAPLEWIPWRFKYNYFCVDESGCPDRGHRMTVIDWGLLELYRKTAREGGQDVALGQVKAKMEDMATKDLMFIVGNQHLYPKVWMIIGLMFPPTLSQRGGDQLGLDLL